MNQLLLLVGMLVVIFLGLMLLGRALERGNRARDLRISAHMDRCRRGSRCFHPDHVHPEPEPTIAEEIEGIWNRI